ncbi:MAG: RnfABCDGE type electron transport complex subunit D, partial [Lachnospiraceae bacterium]|nr:RnfABCDGE type electron transport complex subunit D [Lachnospiraceae bacterium]
MSKQTVSISPHIRSNRSTQSIMLDVVIALMPAVIASGILFGLRAILLTAVSSAVCVLLEWGWQKMMKKEVTVQDLSALVTGMLVAMNVPVSLPIWMLIVGDIAAIILVKQLFGGLGCNFVNPALVGRLVMMFSFASPMNAFGGSTGLVDAATSATP